jgi:hypothetical protein
MLPALFVELGRAKEFVFATKIPEPRVIVAHSYRTRLPAACHIAVCQTDAGLSDLFSGGESMVQIRKTGSNRSPSIHL